jgi:hypothetical protein
MLVWNSQKGFGETKKSSSTTRFYVLLVFLTGIREQLGRLSGPAAPRAYEWKLGHSQLRVELALKRLDFLLDHALVFYCFIYVLWP